MNLLKAKVIIIVACLLGLGMISKSHAGEWPAIAVARNARAMARSNTEAACIYVGHITGALPYCMAMIKHEPDRCEVLTDALLKVLCKEDAKIK